MTAPTEKSNPWLKRLPFLLILAVAVTGFFTLRDSINFDTLARNRDALLAFRDENFALTSLGFLGVYVLIVGFSLPGATVTSLAGGFLFGMFPGVLYNVTGATLGAVAIFLAARLGFGADIAARIERKGGGAARLQQALRKNVWSVLLMMRLVPAVPFFLANLIPAFVGVRLFPYAMTTFFGIIPGAFVFTSIGSGLGEVFARGERPDLSLIFAPHVFGPILGLAALSALPMVVDRFRKDR